MEHVEITLFIAVICCLHVTKLPNDLDGSIIGYLESVHVGLINSYRITEKPADEHDIFI